MDLNEENPDEKLKSLNESVNIIDKLTKNFHNATQEEEVQHKNLTQKLNDVISGKVDPKDLYKNLKQEDTHLDVNEMLQHGHINKSSEKMKGELERLLKKNQ